MPYLSSKSPVTIIISILHIKTLFLRITKVCIIKYDYDRKGSNYS